MQRQIPDKTTLARLYLIEHKSLAEIGKKYGFSANTVGKWLKLYEIPARPAYPTFQLRRVNGRLHKLCKGPSHKKPIWLPLENFTRRKDKLPRSQCRQCDSFRRNSQPLVVLTLDWRGKIESIVNRLGVMETARRLQISQAALWKLRHPTEKTKMKKRTATKILFLLRELNNSHEVRHRDSIHHGSYIRGKEEKPVISRRDLYKSFGDDNRESNSKRRRSA